MSQQEKIALLEEIMDLDEGVLSLDTVLEDIEEWDSVAILSFIATMDEHFEKTIKGSDIKAFVTVQDAIAVME